MPAGSDLIYHSQFAEKRVAMACLKTPSNPQKTERKEHKAWEDTVSNPATLHSTHRRNSQRNDFKKAELVVCLPR